MEAFCRDTCSGSWYNVRRLVGEDSKLPPKPSCLESMGGSRSIGEDSKLPPKPSCLESIGGSGSLKRLFFGVKNAVSLFILKFCAMFAACEKVSLFDT
jgi:hypothetical protein